MFWSINIKRAWSMRSWNFSVNVSELARVNHRELDLQCGKVMGKFPRNAILPLLLV